MLIERQTRAYLDFETDLTSILTMIRDHKNNSAKIEKFAVVLQKIKLDLEKEETQAFSELTNRMGVKPELRRPFHLTRKELQIRAIASLSLALVFFFLLDAHKPWRVLYFAYQLFALMLMVPAIIQLFTYGLWEINKLFDRTYKNALLKTQKQSALLTELINFNESYQAALTLPALDNLSPADVLRSYIVDNQGIAQLLEHITTLDNDQLLGLQTELALARKVMINHKLSLTANLEQRIGKHPQFLSGKQLAVSGAAFAGGAATFGSLGNALGTPGPATCILGVTGGVLASTFSIVGATLLTALQKNRWHTRANNDPGYINNLAMLTDQMARLNSITSVVNLSLKAQIAAAVIEPQPDLAALVSP